MMEKPKAIPIDIVDEVVRLCEAYLDWPTSEIAMQAAFLERQRLARQIYDASFDDGGLLAIRRLTHDILA